MAEYLLFDKKLDPTAVNYGLSEIVKNYRGKKIYEYPVLNPVVINPDIPKGITSIAYEIPNKGTISVFLYNPSKLIDLTNYKGKGKKRVSSLVCFSGFKNNKSSKKLFKESLDRIISSDKMFKGEDRLTKYAIPYIEAMDNPNY